MSVASKLQVKPGQRVVVRRLPADVVLDLDPADIDPASADAIIVFAWVAYPKAGQLGTDLNRDKLAAALKRRGIQPVRQVSIDDAWSALRFRPG